MAALSSSRAGRRTASITRAASAAAEQVRSRGVLVVAYVGDDPDAGQLLPVLLALTAWGKAHIPGGGPLLTHADCGEPVEVTLRCAAVHEVVEEEVLVTGRRLAGSSM